MVDSAPPRPPEPEVPKDAPRVGPSGPVADSTHFLRSLKRQTTARRSKGRAPGSDFRRGNGSSCSERASSSMGREPMSTIAALPTAVSARGWRNAIGRRQLDRYPVDGKRYVYLGIVVLTTIILYYLYYVEGAIT